MGRITSTQSINLSEAAWVVWRYTDQCVWCPWSHRWNRALNNSIFYVMIKLFKWIVYWENIFESIIILSSQFQNVSLKVSCKYYEIHVSLCCRLASPESIKLHTPGWTEVNITPHNHWQSSIQCPVQRLWPYKALWQFLSTYQINTTNRIHYKHDTPEQSNHSINNQHKKYQLFFLQITTYITKLYFDADQSTQIMMHPTQANHNTHNYGSWNILESHLKVTKRVTGSSQDSNHSTHRGK